MYTQITQSEWTSNKYGNWKSLVALLFKTSLCYFYIGAYVKSKHGLI